MKSDNANGLFEFTSSQSLSRMVFENSGNVTFDVQRTLGYRGEVTVNWEIFRENGSRAFDDFISSSGSLTFADGEREKVDSINHVLDPVHTGPDPHGHHINLKSLNTSMTLKFVIILQNLIKAYHRKSGKSKYDRKVTELDVETTRIRSRVNGVLLSYNQG